jgi:hypothetical protein
VRAPLRREQPGVARRVPFRRARFIWEGSRGPPCTDRLSVLLLPTAADHRTSIEPLRRKATRRNNCYNFFGRRWTVTSQSDARSFPRNTKLFLRLG